VKALENTNRRNARNINIFTLCDQNTDMKNNLKAYNELFQQSHFIKDSRYFSTNIDFICERYVKVCPIFTLINNDRFFRHRFSKYFVELKHEKSKT